jgi:O-antigen ligase/tetratricopeptide (TPR) repeat protein
VNTLSIFLVGLSLFIAGVIGITFSIVTQTPAVIVAGLAALTSSISIIRQHTIGGACSKHQKFKYGWLTVFMVLSICYFVVRALLSPVLDLGINDLMLIMPAGILYLLAGILLVGKQAVRVRLTLAWAIILLLILHVASSFIQLQGAEGFSPVYYFMGATPASQGHVIGMYGYYGSFANFAVIAGLLCLSLGVWGRFAYPIRSLIFVLGIISFCLAVLSQSRSGIVSMFPGLGVFSILLILSLQHQSLQIKRRASFVMGGIMSVAFIGLIIAAYWVIQSRGGGDPEGGLNSIFNSVARLNFWPMAYEQWLDFPIFGAGARSFSYLCLLYWNPNLTPTHANPEFVHNEYLQLLADYGLIGFVIVVIALVAHTYIGWMQTRKLAKMTKDSGLGNGSNAMALTIAGMSGMAAMSVYICFDFRTHLLANLLLLACCAVWTLPIRSLGETAPSETSADRAWWRSKYAAANFLLLALGLGAIGLGGHQLWAGMPLVDQKILKEDGAWKPHQVNKSVWIPVLEKSLSRAPRWQRSKRLGILYKIEADEATQPEIKNKLYAKAEAACLASIDRHKYDPIPRINLAAIYTIQSRYEEADKAYADTQKMAKVREPWLMMHKYWASLRHLMAVKCLEEGQLETAEIHFLKAIDLFELSRDAGATMWPNNWKQAYTQCLLAYAIYLDAAKRYDDAVIIYTKVEVIQKASDQLAAIGFYNYKGLHYYNHSIKIYYGKSPRKAYRLMLLASESMRMSRRYSKAAKHFLIDSQTEEIQKYIRFFEAAGIAK